MWVEKHGKVWRIRDRSGGELITISGGYPTKKRAQTAMTLAGADELRGEALIPRGGRITLTDFIDEWWPAYVKTLAPSAQHSEGGRVNNHIRPLLGRYTLDELQDATLIEAWVADLADGEGPMGKDCKRPRKPLAAKTIGNCHGMLFVIMKAAIAKRRIKINPCAGTPLPRREQHEMMFLTDPEIARLILAFPKHWRPLILLLVSTGLRWGEATGLRVGRVNLEAKRPQLRVVEQLQEMSGTGELYFCPPKTQQSRRTVSFTTMVVDALTPLVKGKRRDELVFLTPGGLTIRTRNFRRIWLRACKRAGLEGLRVHDLRHTHAAVLISAGRSLSAIARRFGHKSVAITDSVYGHLREEVDEGVLAAIDESMALLSADELAAELAGEFGRDLDLAA